MVPSLLFFLLEAQSSGLPHFPFLASYSPHNYNLNTSLNVGSSLCIINQNLNQHFYEICCELSDVLLYTFSLKAIQNYPQKDDGFLRIPILKVVLKEITKGMHSSATDASTLFLILIITSTGVCKIIAKTPRCGIPTNFTHKGQMENAILGSLMSLQFIKNSRSLKL